MYGEQLITAPVLDLLTLTQAKAQLRVEHSVDDTIIADKLGESVAFVQDQSNRQLLTATRDFTFDRFPIGSEPQLLPRAPLQSVSQITYIDTAGDSQTISSGTIASDYTVVAAYEPGRIAPLSGNVWPIAVDQPGAVTYRVVCGWTAASLVDQAAVSAVKLALAHFYESREATVGGTIIRTIPHGLQDLLHGLSYDDFVDYRPRRRRVTHHPEYR